MTFVADESLDGPIVYALRGLGHQVIYIAETEASIADAMVLARAVAVQVILLTADKDFGELVFKQGLQHFGIVLIRLAGCTPAEKAIIVSQTIAKYGVELELAFCVISEKLVRIRRPSVH